MTKTSPSSAEPVSATDHKGIDFLADIIDSLWTRGSITAEEADEIFSLINSLERDHRKMREALEKGVEVTGDTSDGYHTFNELYDHRMALWIALCKHYAGRVWRSKKHSDGGFIEGWFILGMNKEKGEQITYHLPMSRWNGCDFAETLETAPDFDGHTSEDVLYRIEILETPL